MSSNNIRPVVLYSEVENEAVTVTDGALHVTSVDAGDTSSITELLTRIGYPQGTYFNEILRQRDTLNVDAIGDYAGDPKDFLYTIPDGTDVYHIARVLVLIEANGTFEPDIYGPSNGINSPLPNGINMFIKRDGEPKQYLTPVAITANVDWSMYCYDVRYSDYGSGNETLEVRWSFNKGNPTGLILSEKDEFGFELADDFSSFMIRQRFVIQGYSVTPTA